MEHLSLHEVTETVSSSCHRCKHSFVAEFEISKNIHLFVNLAVESNLFSEIWLCRVYDREKLVVRAWEIVLCRERNLVLVSQGSLCGQKESETFVEEDFLLCLLV